MRSIATKVRLATETTDLKLRAQYVDLRTKCEIQKVHDFHHYQKTTNRRRPNAVFVVSCFSRVKSFETNSGEVSRVVPRMRRTGFLT